MKRQQPTMQRRRGMEQEEVRGQTKKGETQFGEERERITKNVRFTVKCKYPEDKEDGKASLRSGHLVYCWAKANDAWKLILSVRAYSERNCQRVKLSTEQQKAGKDFRPIKLLQTR